MFEVRGNRSYPRHPRRRRQEAPPPPDFQPLKSAGGP